MPDPKPRKGRPQRIGSLIPEAARALGFEAELELSKLATTFTRVLQATAPHLAQKCRLIGSERGRLIVEADDRSAAQELHLRGAEIASAYTQHREGSRAIGISVRLSNVNQTSREND
jgi:hypothetical protein